MRVSLDWVVQLAGDAKRLQAGAEDVCGRLVGVLREHDGSHGEPLAAEQVHEAQDVLVIGDAEVAARLVLLDVVGVDGDDDLDVVGEALEHAELGVWLEPGQHAARVVVVEQLAAELEVELAAELGDALADVLGLQLDVLVVVESLAHAPSLAWPRGAGPRTARSRLSSFATL